MNFAWNARLPRSIQLSFTCRKCTTWDRQLYFPSEGRCAEDFFALKNPTALAGFEPANLGTKGQHATSKPPKPLMVPLTGYDIKACVTRRVICWKQLEYTEFCDWNVTGLYISLYVQKHMHIKRWSLLSISQHVLRQNLAICSELALSDLQLASSTPPYSNNGQRECKFLGKNN